MTPRHRFAALGALFAGVAAAVAGWAPAPLGAVTAGLAVAGLALLVDRRVLAPAARLGRDLEALAQSRRVDHALALPPEHDLGALPEAAAAVVEALRAARRDMRQAMDSVNAHVAEQRSWLEAILLDLSDGVVVCNPAHEILLHNQAAGRLLGAPELLGPGKSLFALLTKPPVLHTLERLEQPHGDGDTAQMSTPFVCATADSRVMLQGRMALMRGANRVVTGYVITLTDISAEVATLARTDSVRRAVTWGLRGPVANLRAAAEMLSAFPGMAAEERAAFDQVMLHESVRISEQIDTLAREDQDGTLTPWPMADIYAADLFNCVARRLTEEDGIGLTVIGIPLWLHGDSLSLVLALTDLIRRIRQFAGAAAFDVEVLLSDRRVYVDLTWLGPFVPSGLLEDWRDDPMEGAPGNQTIRDVLERHGSEPWSQARPHGRAVLRLPLPAPHRPQFRARADELPPRPELHDPLVMAEHSVPGPLADRPLRDLELVAFDTETTGLKAEEGDQIVALAGVRVVRGRVLPDWRFERLVNPQRPIAPDSIRFHGITDAMVVGKPPIRVVLPQFRTFVGDAVLVAHNAAFDLGFLRQAGTGGSSALRNPALDTLLLSVLLDPAETDHSLDAVARRLGVPVTDRYTALGDALVAAAILVQQIDRLEAQGIRTLEQAMRASEAVARSRVQMVQA